MTTPALTTLRSTLATKLAAATTYQVFAYPQATLIANSVTIVPDDPYLEPSNDSWATIGPLAHFKLLIAVPFLDNQGALNSIEQAIVTLFTTFYNTTTDGSLAYNVGNVSQPQILSAASGDMLTCEMQISLVTTWS
jgi:hypothetical protein